MKLFFCFFCSGSGRQKNKLDDDNDTIMNPIYSDENEEPPQKHKLIRKSKEDYCSEAKGFLKDLDDYLADIV